MDLDGIEAMGRPEQATGVLRQHHEHQPSFERNADEEMVDQLCGGGL
jgi:hypothetical protein